MAANLLMRGNNHHRSQRLPTFIPTTGYVEEAGGFTGFNPVALLARRGRQFGDRDPVHVAVDLEELVNNNLLP
jgi:hypothetical protein